MKTLLIFLIFFSCSLVCLSVEFKLKLPVAATVNIVETKGTICIDETFKQTRAFNNQLNKQIDRKHAWKIAQNALEKFFSIRSGSMTYSQMQMQGSLQYDDGYVKATFTVPRNAIRFVAHKQLPSTPQEKRVETHQKQDSSRSTSKEGQNIGQSIQSIANTKKVPTRGKALTDMEKEYLSASEDLIRLKQDYTSAFEVKQEEISEFLKEANWEALTSMAELKKNFASQYNLAFIREQYRFNAVLTQKELNALLKFIEDEKKKIDESIITSYKQLYDTIYDDLIAHIKQRRSAIQKEGSSSKDEPDEELLILKEQMKALEKLKP